MPSVSSVISWAISTIIILSNGQLEPCLFNDSTETMTLDLRPLYNKTLGPYSDGTYEYTYSVCANSLFCNTTYETPQYRMIDQHEPNGTIEGECWWLAEWKQPEASNENPQYDERYNYWRFPQYVGQNTPDGPRGTTVYWRCNQSVEAEFVYVQNTSNKDYDIMIDSKYACQSTDTCIWHASDGTMLDLNAFDNTIITAVDTSGNGQVFAYTPCRNGVKCDDLEVMAKLESVDNSTCSTYLSKWNENAAYEYDSNNKIWEFTYKSGETCDDSLSSSFYVYWFCNDNVIEPNYVIKKAEHVGPCLYELEIETRLAC